MGTNGCPQEALAARQRQSRWAMPTAPGMPGAAPSDPGHGGEGAGDGCAGIMPPPGGPGVGEPGDRQVPGQVPHPARTRSRASTGHGARTSGDAGRRQARAARHLASVPGRRLMPAAQSAKSAGTPPGDDDLVPPPRTRGGGRQPALPAGQQPARGALAIGKGPRRASARERQGLAAAPAATRAQTRTWLDRYVAGAQDCPR